MIDLCGYVALSAFKPLSRTVRRRSVASSPHSPPPHPARDPRCMGGERTGCRRWPHARPTGDTGRCHETGAHGSAARNAGHGLGLRRCKPILPICVLRYLADNASERGRHLLTRVGFVSPRPRKYNEVGGPHSLQEKDRWNQLMLGPTSRLACVLDQ